MPLGVDILLTPEGPARFRKKLVGRGYVADFPGAAKSFRDAETNVKVEIITAGEFPGDGLPNPVLSYCRFLRKGNVFISISRP